MTTVVSGTHPLLRFAAAVDDALDRVVDVDPTYCSPAEKREALLALLHAEERLTALRLRVQACSDDVASLEGARDAGALVAHAARRDRRRVGFEQHLAEALEARWTATGEAWRAGRLNGDQAAAIAESLDRLPEWVAPDRRVSAEQHLLSEAAHHDPHALRVLGRRLWEVIAPDDADAAELRALEAEERRAHAATRLTLRRLGDGSTRLTARVPDALAARLGTLLEAHTSPRRDHLTGDVRDPATGERLPAAQLRGQAFCTLVEHADPARLPTHGGTATTLLVTMDLDRLRAQTGSGMLPDGTPLSASEVRRLACTSHLVPVVLGSDSEVLDLGRTSRLFSPAQRRALAVRDRSCRAEGCSVPAAWCEAHHRHPWAAGGRTDLADGVLLCPFHHHRVHDSRYDSTRLPSGDLRFHRRT